MVNDVEENEPMEAVAKAVANAVEEGLAIEEAVEAVFGPAPADDLGGRMYFATVLREALRSALIQDGLSRGLHETTKALEKGQALLCIKAENCNDDEYKKYVQALCEEHQIPFLTVPDNMNLGKYAGFCKLDDKGNKRDVDQCSYIAVKDWGKKGLTIDFINEKIKKSFVSRPSNYRSECTQQHTVGHVDQLLQFGQGRMTSTPNVEVQM